MTPMEIELRTLTPLWTGGVDQVCDRVHETGLIGSLRWWYEALVRGLGGYACDPTSENPDARCSFDSKAYERTKAKGRSDVEAIREGLKTVCPVCYLFGATGWARLFQLRTIDAPTTPLHFCTTLRMNQGWLKRVFGGATRVPYGNVRFQFATRRQDEDYAKRQFALALRMAAEYGGVGARLQHGFGQVSLQLPSEMEVSVTDGIRQLVAKLQPGELRSSGPQVETPFDFRNFVGLDYNVPEDVLRDFINARYYVGQKPQSASYLPCVFDLRYKGEGKWGMRQWLKQKGWKESAKEDELGELDLLLGPRSQWGPKGRERKIDEKLRTASRVFLGMPYRKDGGKGAYILRVWAFLPHELQAKLPTPEALRDLCDEYIQHVLGVKPASVTLGKDILTQVQGGLK
jgi:CRISPR-associated protein Cmr1